MLLILLAYAGIPLIAGWMVSGLVTFLSFDLLGIVSYFPLALTGFACPFLVLSSIHAYLQDGLFSDSWDVRNVFITAWSNWTKLVIPVFAFWGIVLLAVPLFGLSFFIGSWVLIAYSTALRFSQPEDSSSYP